MDNKLEDKKALFAEFMPLFKEVLMVRCCLRSIRQQAFSLSSSLLSIFYIGIVKREG